jgi:glyoxylase-like metal-dependent hydrolase (beta-lactamase superfamily II)
MLRKCLTAAVLVTALSWSAHAQDAKGVISTAMKAMGGEGLATIQYSGPGSEFSFGQAFDPKLAWPAWRNKTYTRTLDFETPAFRIDRVAEPPDPQRQGGGLQPGPTQTVVVNQNTAWAQQLPLWTSPQGFLRAAAAGNPTVATQSVGGRTFRVVRFVGSGKAEVRGFINDQNMVERVETTFDNAMLGDTPHEAVYSDYKDFGGVRFPTRIVERQGGHPTLDMTVTDVKANPGAVQAPQGRGGAPGGGAPGGGGPQSASQKLADGVYLILPAYAALAVDFKDGIVIVEGPQSEARASAIIDEAKRLIPNKPIRYVVNTHGHFDHSSGLRTFIAEGATIVTHQINAAYYQKIFALPHTLNPDRQEKAKRNISIETMTDRKVLTDGNHVIELHRLQNGRHNDGMIVAYLPREKLLVQADAFNPPAQADAPPPSPVNANHVNLVENLNRLKLDVETLIPVHYPADGRKVSIAELRRAVGQAN